MQNVQTRGNPELYPKPKERTSLIKLCSRNFHANVGVCFTSDMFSPTICYAIIKGHNSLPPLPWG